MDKILALVAAGILFSSQVWAEPSSFDYVRANVKCTRAVEEVALNAFEWTESLFEMKFKFILHNAGKNLDSYATETIRLKNEFGIWRNHICVCAWDLKREQILGVGCHDKGY